MDEEVSELVGGLVEWHTESFAGHDAVRLDDLVCFAFNFDESSIKMHNIESAASEGIDKWYFLIHTNLCKSVRLLTRLSTKKSFLGDELQLEKLTFYPAH